MQRDVFIGKLWKSDLPNCISGQVGIVPKVPILMFLKRWLILNIERRNTQLQKIIGLLIGVEDTADVQQQKDKRTRKTMKTIGSWSGVLL